MSRMVTRVEAVLRVTGGSDAVHGTDSEGGTVGKGVSVVGGQAAARTRASGCKRRRRRRVRKVVRGLHRTATDMGLKCQLIRQGTDEMERWEGRKEDL